MDIHSNKYDLLMLSAVSVSKLAKCVFFSADGIGISHALFQNMSRLKRQGEIIL